jgi:hypothetical protein
MTGQGPRFDVKPFLNQDEGQHFDRKSLFHGPPGEKHPAIVARCVIRLPAIWPALPMQKVEC